jgi:cytochrome c2
MRIAGRKYRRKQGTKFNYEQALAGVDQYVTNTVICLYKGGINPLKPSLVAAQKKVKPVVVLLISCPIFAANSGFLSTFFRSNAHMSSYKPITRKSVLLAASLFVLSFINTTRAQDGKALFQNNCASCHNVFKESTGPALGGVINKEKYGGDVKNTYSWIRNATAMGSSDPYYVALKKQYNNAIMTSYPALKDEEINAIFTYIEDTYKAGPTGGQKPGAPVEAPGSNKNWIIFGIISLILAIIALILMQVNSNLKKLSDDKENILRPEPVPFYRNKIYLAMAALLFFTVGGYFVTKGAVGLGRQKDYQPEQPIYYSHKVHAGINQINCLYCHGGAYEGKHANIPSVNVCMNCHKSISTYEKGPQLYDGNGEKVDGTAEIAKLYQYAGFDPKNANAWTPDKIKEPIHWKKIHNLPDHVYFNHAQHTKAGQVQCQSCHGNIQEMDEVYQFSDLSMGWCINCHRQTNVNFNYNDSTGNKYYSIYEKFHKDLQPDTLRDDHGHFVKNVNGEYTIRKPKMDSVKVKDIGGLECQKCHY